MRHLQNAYSGWLVLHNPSKNPIGFKVRSIKWAKSRKNLPSGSSTKRVSNRSPQLQRLARKLKFYLIRGQIWYFPKKLLTKSLIRLRGCACWSAPVLLANPRRQVSSCHGPNCPAHKLFKTYIFRFSFKSIAWYYFHFRSIMVSTLHILFCKL